MRGVHTKSKVLAVNGIATGSIVGIYAPAAASVTDANYGVYVHTGDFSLISSSITQFSDTAIAIPEGTYLEGPFAAIHMNNVATVIYYNGELKEST